VFVVKEIMEEKELVCREGVKGCNEKIALFSKTGQSWYWCGYAAGLLVVLRRRWILVDALIGSSKKITHNSGNRNSIMIFKTFFRL
jgi:hypothetical protein